MVVIDFDQHCDMCCLPHMTSSCGRENENKFGKNISVTILWSTFELNRRYSECKNRFLLILCFPFVLFCFVFFSFPFNFFFFTVFSSLLCFLLYCLFFFTVFSCFFLIILFSFAFSFLYFLCLLFCFVFSFLFFFLPSFLLRPIFFFSFCFYHFSIFRLLLRSVISITENLNKEITSEETRNHLAQSAGAGEYTNCTSAEE